MESAAWIEMSHSNRALVKFNSGHLLYPSSIKMILVLRTNGYFTKKLSCLKKASIVKRFLTAPDHNASSKISYYTYKHLQTRIEFPESHLCQLTTMLPFVHIHNSCYSHTDAKYSSLRNHSGFSKKLSTTREIGQIGTLVMEWLRRFDSLSPIEPHNIAGALSELSKQDIFIRKWKGNDQENIKKLIVTLAANGYYLLDPKSETSSEFRSWEVANCLNALSKWDIWNTNIWNGNVRWDGKDFTKISLLESFIIRLINRGRSLLDQRNKSDDRFDPQNITNCLNALTKWDIGKLPGAKEFIVELIKQGTETAGSSSSQRRPRSDTFSTVGIVRNLHAMSLLDTEELPGSREFINQLIKLGIQTVHQFTPRDVLDCLNALSKRNINNSRDSHQFIFLLMKRGASIVDQFDARDIAKCLNVLSQWDIREIRGAEDFVILLMERGSSMANEFNLQNVDICLNAVSKWDVDKLQGARKFIEQLKCENEF